MVLIKSRIKGQKDCKVLICNETVEFNSECIAEVSSMEKAEEIVSKFGAVISILDKDGNEPEKEEVKEEVDVESLTFTLSDEVKLAMANAGGMDPELLGGWTSCMKKHIINHYGTEIEDCVNGISHSNWTKVLKCMVTVLGIADPEIWIPEQLALFAEWSVTCLFGEEDKGGDDEEDEDEIDLNSKTVAQLRELCKSIELPSSEYKSLKKPELIAYIEEKIK